MSGTENGRVAASRNRHHREVPVGVDASAAGRYPTSRIRAVEDCRSSTVPDVVNS